LRTKSAVDAIKFTLQTTKMEEPTAEVVEVNQVVSEQDEAKKMKLAAQNAAKFAKQNTQEVDVQPMSAEEMKALIAQAKAGEGDDCLMCGS
ncbi:MAG: ribonucleoside-diphosphate reductase subunit alpha, partial [Flaviramulus sp.]|nr:ribonucleoside-diphosphate reductase subunit alpha [Flaviramulus sp.]